MRYIQAFLTAKKAKQNDHEGGDEALVQSVAKKVKKLSFEDD